MDRLRRNVPKFFRHIGRHKAIVGWVVIFLVLAFEFGVMKLLLRSDVLDVYAGILVSVVLSYIFLPDAAGDVRAAAVESSLWLKDAGTLKDLLTPTRLETATQQLLAASLGDEDYARAAWRVGCQPFINARINRHLILDDLTYDIAITTDEEDTALFRVVTTHVSRRTLVPADDGTLWTSFARTLTALRGEYESKECLLRELVEVDPNTWTRISRRLAASLIVGGRRYEGIAEARKDLIRMRFGDVVIGNGPTDTQVHCTFFMPSTIHYFPVKLNHICRGKTTIGLTVAGPVESLLDFVSLGPEFRPGEEDPWDRNGGSGGYAARRISTSGDAIVLPGSGVVFVWGSAR